MLKIFYFIPLIFLFIPDIVRNTESVTVFPPSEITVIGTVHKATPEFTSDTLLNILNKINPDLILVECDSSYMTSDFELKDDFKYAFVETCAITEYKKNKPVKLRPYDIAGRDFFFDDPVRNLSESDFFNEIRYLSGSGKENLNEESVVMLDKINSILVTADELSNSKASFINSQEGNAEADTINYYTYEGISRLISLTPELHQYKSYWDAECNYENLRNLTMVENILNYVKSFQGKKIVVLCGFAHKNFLKRGLMSNDIGEKNFIIKEIREY